MNDAFRLEDDEIVDESTRAIDCLCPNATRAREKVISIEFRNVALEFPQVCGFREVAP